MPKITKTDLSVFCTNLVAIVLSIIFIRAYVLRGISLLPLAIITFLGSIILTISIIIRPSLFPEKRLFLINISISIIAGLIFFGELHFFGFTLVQIISILLSVLEQIIHEVMK